MLIVLLVLVGTLGLALALRRPPELFYSVIALGLLVLSMVVPGGRVLTIPFFLMLTIICLFWLARRAAEREEL